MPHPTYATQVRARQADRFRSEDPVIRAAEHVLANVVLAGRKAADHERLLQLAVYLLRDGLERYEVAEFHRLVAEDIDIAHPDDRPVLQNISYALVAWDRITGE